MMYDEFTDEETRRRQREEQGGGSNINPGWDQGQYPDWDPRTGLGTPESGYGEGGVENPAYNSGGDERVGDDYKGLKQTGDDVFRGNINTRPYTPAPQPAFQPPQSAPAPMAAPAAPAAPAPQVKTPGITDEVTKILMSKLGQLKNPGDVSSDPIYQQAVRQNQIGQLRSADRQRKALAERTAATGGTTRSGGFNVGVQGINERAGENAAQYRSGLALDRLSAREQQLSEYIKMARAVGQDDIANQLELQRLQLQQELGRGDLALRGELGRGQLGLGYDNLGFNYADLVTRANRDATLAALNGGG